MRGQEFRARDKKVQKLGRDGLVEQNKATGEERRVSQRTADMSFGPERKPDQQLGRQSSKKSKKRSIKSELQPLRPDLDRAVPLSESPEPSEGLEKLLEPCAATEADIAPVIRDTRGVSVSHPNRTEKQRGRRSRDGPAASKQQREGRQHTDTPAPEAPGSRGSRQKGRLRFEDGDALTAAVRTSEKRRGRSAITTSGTIPSQSGDMSPLRQSDIADSHVALEAGQHSEDPAASVSDGHGKPPDIEPPPPGRLRFEATSVPEKDGELPHRQQRRYEKAERRVEQAGRKLEKAQEKIPAKRRAHLEKQYDSESGRVRRHLRFEKEAVPENAPSALPKRVGGAVVRTAQTTAVLKAHQKLREAERDNTGVEAAHKVEFVAERGAGRFLRWNKNRLHSKPYRAVRQAQSRLQTEQTRLAWQTALRDHPELQQRSTLSKWHQKQKIKRKYAQAAREAQKTAQHTQNVLTTTGKIVRAVAQAVSAHKSALAFIALLALVVMLFSTGLSACTAMLSGFQSTYIATTYLANEQDICNSD
ncbi:MAG: hypothetical protein K2O45_03060, partial [Oscillospiraceae bacterium]|nr:hypothetical protein [Oscillospiraceae bacterium]